MRKTYKLPKKLHDDVGKTVCFESDKRFIFIAGAGQEAAIPKSMASKLIKFLQEALDDR